MLGRCSRPLLRTTSKSILIPGDGLDDQPAGFCHSSLVSDKYSGPAPCAPRQVVIGFDLGAENKPSDACESPRSVLDPNALSLPQEKQAAARSPRSYLRSLLTGKKGSQGVGLGIIVDIQTEEEENAKESFFPAVPAAVCSQPIPIVQNFLNHHSQPIPVVHNHLHQRSQPISIGRNHLHQHRVHEPNHDNEVSRYGIANPFLNPGQNKEMVGACKASSPEGMDYEVTSWQRRVLRSHPIQDMEDDEEINIRQSIFSAASPPSNCCSIDMPSMGFLNACFFCGCSLLQGKDIFMYR